jgi:hypothetical protein
MQQKSGSTHIEITKPSYLPFKEQFYGFDKSNLEDEMMYAKAEILFNIKINKANGYFFRRMA